MYLDLYIDITDRRRRELCQKIISYFLKLTLFHLKCFYQFMDKIFSKKKKRKEKKRKKKIRKETTVEITQKSYQLRGPKMTFCTNEDITVVHYFLVLILRTISYMSSRWGEDVFLCNMYLFHICILIILRTWSKCNTLVYIDIKAGFFWLGYLDIVIT